MQNAEGMQLRPPRMEATHCGPLTTLFMNHDSSVSQWFHPHFKINPDPEQPQGKKKIGVLSWNLDPETPKVTSRASLQYKSGCQATNAKELRQEPEDQQLLSWKLRILSFLHNNTLSISPIHFQVCNVHGLCLLHLCLLTHFIQSQLLLAPINSSSKHTLLHFNSACLLSAERK